MAFLLDKAHLLGLFLQTITFGIFLTFFIILIVIRVGTDQIRLGNPKFVFSIASVMMLFATAHLILDFVRGMQGFTTGEATRLPNPISYYGDVANPLDGARNLIYGLQTILGDAVLVWRCYIVYNESLYILVSAGVVLLGNIALTVLVTWSFHTITPGEDYYQTGAWRFVACFIITTMVLNIGCTVAIVFKVWQTHRRISSNCDLSLFPVIAVIIESGAIYTTSIAGFAITFLLRSNGQHPALSLITPLVGVVFCLIVLQIHVQLRLLKPLRTSRGSRSIQFGWRESVRADVGEHATRAIAVHYLEHKHFDRELGGAINSTTI